MSDPPDTIRSQQKKGRTVKDTVRTYNLGDLFANANEGGILDGVIAILTPNGRKIEAGSVDVYTAKNGHTYLRFAGQNENGETEFAQFRVTL